MRLSIPSNLTDRKGLFACLSVGFIARLIPEFLAFPNPIGFDTVYYATVMKSGVIWLHWSTFFTSSWLLYALVVPLYQIVGGDPFLLLKVLGPILFGLNVAGIFWFARKMLSWNWRMGLAAGILFAVQLASLRISWDLLRNTLGLGLLLFTVPFIREIESGRGFVSFILLSLLTVFAHEYAAVILLTTVLGLVGWRLIRRRMDLSSRCLLLAITPALCVFSVGIFLRVFPVHYVVQSNVIGAGDVISASHGGLFFLTDYLQVHSSLDYYATYWNLALSVVVLFAVLFLPYLLLVLKGFFKNDVLNLWTGLLLIGAFGCLIVPFYALEYWHRWMFMLVYPFTFYAINGLKELSLKLQGRKISFPWFVSKKATAMVSLTFLLGVTYLATPVLMAYVGATASVVSVSGIDSSSPSSSLVITDFSRVFLYFSTSPTVPYQDVAGVVQAMGWLDANMDAASCVILQNAFVSWGELYLDKSHEIVSFQTDSNMAVNTALEHGFSQLYFVSWNVNIGWYGITVPNGFIRLKDFGRISVYECGSV